HQHRLSRPITLIVESNAVDLGKRSRGGIVADGGGGRIVLGAGLGGPACWRARRRDQKRTDSQNYWDSHRGKNYRPVNGDTSTQGREGVLCCPGAQNAAQKSSFEMIHQSPRTKLVGVANPVWDRAPIC